MEAPYDAQSALAGVLGVAAGVVVPIPAWPALLLGYLAANPP